MSDDILTSKEKGVVRIKLNRPDKMNALTRAMYSAMADALIDAEEDKTVRLVAIEGSGGNFTSGNDLADFMGSPSFDPDAPVQRFLRSMIMTSVPVIAAVSGYAVGVGVTMLMHFDKVICTRDAKLKLPFVDMGLVPEAGSSLLLPGKVGYTRAADLIMTGRSFSGEEACAFDIATDLAEDEAGLAAALEDAIHVYAARPPTVMRRTKRLLRGSRDDLMERMQLESRYFAKSLAGPECHEAIAAFMEKRAPDFSSFEAEDD